MTRVAPSVTFVLPRLVSLLAEHTAAQGGVSHSQFARRLGDLIDLSNSVALSETLSLLGKQEFIAVDDHSAGGREDFLRVRAAMISAVLRSLFPGSGATRIRWPKVTDGEAPQAQAYRKFYAAHQGEMEARVRGLQERVRDTASGLSPELLKLASLDAAVGDSLLAHSRRLFASIPALVADRFEALESPAALDTTFRSEVQALLLAEIEARLLPVQGLIEAMDELTDRAL
ncbi:DUF3348 family protein [Parahaliea sp. F7430]|uniref:DUF3348 family protein n=1 Tax=Sediminihaliea albiluteola TaxID=2758564 RepID=A0A7W2YJC6_9GAMM|nr:DUF3348 family protein [Sediminihaliea albiluteola]MBA6412158.1 DUF3348 family protein [Sediminihaliea albiluteola]